MGIDVTVSKGPTQQVTKNRQVRVYLTEENDAILREVKRSMPDLEETEVIRILISTSLRAIKENNFRLSFPMKFKLTGEDDVYRQRLPRDAVLNEKNK